MEYELKQKIDEYEDTYKIYLEYGTPKILRVDMRACKSFTKSLQKPFDKLFSKCMIKTMTTLCNSIPGAKIGYSYSDEISIIIKDLDNENKKISLFNNSLIDITSNVSSMCTLFFNIYWDEQLFEFCKENNIDIHDAKTNYSKYPVLEPYFKLHNCALFNCKYFEVPNIIEVVEYLRYRQNDCYNSSINMIADSCISENELSNIDVEQKLNYLESINESLNKYPIKYTKGEICYKITDNNWKNEVAPNFYNNIEFVKALYNS